MKRSDFPLPYTTGLVDLNSEGAYADEVITLTCPQLGRLEIAVEDNRDPNTVMRGWSPRPYFLETN